MSTISSEDAEMCPKITVEYPREVWNTAASTQQRKVWESRRNSSLRGAALGQIDRSTHCIVEERRSFTSAPKPAGNSGVCSHSLSNALRTTAGRFTSQDWIITNYRKSESNTESGESEGVVFVVHIFTGVFWRGFCRFRFSVWRQNSAGGLFLILCKLFHWTPKGTREYQSFSVHVVSRCVSCHVCTFCFGQTFLRHVSFVSAHAAETHLKQVNAAQHVTTKLAL